MRGVLPWLVRWARRAGTRDLCAALFALVGPVQNFFVLTSFVPISQQAGQAVVQCRLSLHM
jgi:hypothetical protein